MVTTTTTSTSTTSPYRSPGSYHPNHVSYDKSIENESRKMFSILSKGRALVQQIEKTTHDLEILGPIL